MAQGRIRRLVTGREVRRAALCLVFGGVMTVAVAWGCALFVTPIRSGKEARTDGPYYEQYRPDAWPPLDSLYASEGIGIVRRDATGYVRIRLPPGQPWISRMTPFYWIAERQYGLVWRAMSFFESNVAMTNEDYSNPASPVHQRPRFPLIARGIDVPSWFPRRFRGRVLPLRPVWPGFLYSTLAYGAFAWLMLCSLGFLIQRLHVRHRRRRGLCLHCKYPLGDFTICPECGNPTEREA